MDFAVRDRTSMLDKPDFSNKQKIDKPKSMYYELGNFKGTELLCRMDRHDVHLLTSK